VILFLLTYLTVYGGMNLYLFLRVRQAWRLPGFGLPLALLLVLLVAAPVLVRYLDSWGRHGLARPLALVAYLWMAVVLWFLFLRTLADLWNLLARLAALVTGTPARVLPAAAALPAIAAAILLLAAWGWVEARTVRVTRLTLASDRIPPGSPPLTVAQVSDLHAGLLVGPARIRRVTSLLEELGPDLVVSTGDLVDGLAAHLNGTASILAALKPPLGKYAVTGNHEFYVGIAASEDYHRAAGFTLLRGRTVRVDQRLLLTGVDDPASSLSRRPTAAAEDALLAAREGPGARLLLKHQPRVASGTPGLFDLQLSGHTHRGQIFPFGLLVRLSYPMAAGRYDLGGGSTLYVSRGTGTWGPPLRVLSPPEILLVTLVSGTPH
jgi:hypothetical protein